MVKTFKKTLSLILVLSMVITYAASLKTLATGEASYENTFAEDGLYHVWTQELICTDETHHVHAAECYISEAPLCGQESSPCAIPENHTHDSGCYTVCTPDTNPDHYDDNGKHTGACVLVEAGDTGFYGYLTCAMEEKHTHTDACSGTGHTHTETCYRSAEPQCGKAAHYDTCYTWKETTYSYYTVTFISNNGSEDIQVYVVPALPDQFPAPSDFPEISYEGYVFDGWYADAGFTTPADLSALSGSATFYAKWSKNTPEPVVHEETVEVVVGESAELAVQFSDTSNLTNESWTSSDETIATVLAGTVTGVKEGETVITHSYEKDGTLHTTTYYVTVTPASILTYSQAPQNVTGTFYIRLDGQIPYEPGKYPSSQYTAGITIQNVIKSGVFTSGSAAVSQNLNSVPTSAQIKNVYSAYDPTTQYIEWYVIKYDNTDGWHIDGVVLDKAKINLYYHPNCTDYNGEPPIGRQYVEGAAVTVEGPGTLSRPGYTFTGWNSTANGDGTSFSVNSSFYISETTTLYAQWTPNNDTKYTVAHYLETASGSGSYALHESNTQSGTTGSTATASPKTYNGYVFDEDHANNMASGTIAGDGSLVLKFYYNKLPTYSVAYQYTAASGSLPAAISTQSGEFQVSDTNTYLAGATVFLSDKAPAIDTTYTVTENGVTVGTWRLTSWNQTSAVMSESGVVFTGIWTYTPETQYAITYYVDGVVVHTDSYYAGQSVTAYTYAPSETYLTFSGWYSDSSYTTSATIPDVMPADNVNVYGQTSYKSYDYTIHYYYDGVIDNSKTQTLSAAYGASIATYPDQKIDGYKFDRDTAPLVIGTDVSQNVLSVYYVKDSFGYKVEYYYDGVRDDAATVTGTATFGDKISTYSAKLRDGYVLAENGEKNLPLTISSNEENNVISIYYVKGQYAYTVEYYYDGVKDDTKTVIGAAETFGTQVSTYPDKKIDGYKLDKTENLPMTVTANADNNVIRIYYVKDSFGYKVEYYYDGVIDTSKTDSFTATFHDTISSYTDKTRTGYELETVTGLPLNITSNTDENIIRVYYIRSDYTYTVEYYYDGIRDDRATVTGTAKFHDSISTYPDKAADGYIFDHDTAPLTVDTDPANNVIRVYYVKGEFGYRVEYYYDGVRDDGATEYGTATFGDVIDSFTHKYGLNSHYTGASNFPLTITSDPGSNVIRVYYVTVNNIPDTDPSDPDTIPSTNPDPEQPDGQDSEAEPEPGNDLDQDIEDIPDEDVPLTDGGDLAGAANEGNSSEEDNGLTDIVDENVPLADGNGLINIFDEDVPLADIPKTGDSSEWILWAGVLALSSAALTVLLLKGRRKNEADSETK